MYIIVALSLSWPFGMETGREREKEKDIYIYIVIYIYLHVIIWDYMILYVYSSYKCGVVTEVDILREIMGKVWAVGDIPSSKLIVCPGLYGHGSPKLN